MPLLMQEISFNDGVAAVLDSLLSDRLVLLAGAGLSMASPSSLPSAATLAASAKQKYGAMYGATRPPLPAGIEDQAEFFFQRGELGTVYLRKLIDQHAFAGQPNDGHFAVADLLLVRAIQTAITTNVDTLIETAGQHLFGHVGSGIDRDHVAALPPDVSPLLKIHGCRSDPDSMVWALGQLGVPPIADRIATSATWLNVRLLDRDLLIVGYWTDWDYLNEVLEATLGAVNPARVIVVDPSDGSTFETKAPNLYTLGQRASIAFQHVQASGADFLASLRCQFSKSFVRRVLHLGATEYISLFESDPDAAWTEPSDMDNTTLWQLRRDLEGCPPNDPAKEKNPPNESLVGLTLLQLQACGAVPDGSYWLLNGRRVRVLRTANKLLHRVEAEFERETPPTVAPDIVIAVGAEAQALPRNFARAETQPTIARGSSSRWLTRPEAVQELGL
ncbi:MAG: hypothetical protein GC183_05640 [Thiobacillus sp.]|nr:hypothetical protein [Thiobacillus sp.]